MPIMTPNRLLCLVGFHHPVYACGETVAVTACTRCGVEVEERVQLFRPERLRAEAEKKADFYAWAKQSLECRELERMAR